VSRAVRPGRMALAALAVTFAIVAAACGSSDSGEPLDAAQASKQRSRSTKPLVAACWVNYFASQGGRFIQA